MQPAAVLSILVKAQGIQSTAGDLRGLDTNARKAGAGIEAAEKKGSKSLDKLGKQTSLTGRVASNGFSRIQASATGAAAALAGVGFAAKKSVEAAVDLGEQVNKTAVVFRGAEKPILRWATTTASSIGISNRAALEATGVFGNMLVPMGFARKEAAGLSVHLVKLAADMASFNNASPDQVMEALRAGLSGETEPLRQFGVFLNEARVKAEAMSLGLVKATKDTTKIQSAQITATLAQKTYTTAVKEHGKGSDEAHKALVTLNNAQGALNKATSGSLPVLTAAQKAQATYSLILKDTKDAQGDFARTSTSLANQQRILKAQFEDVAAKLGTQLIPALTAAALALSKFITQMQSGTGAGGKFVTIVQSMAHNFSAFATHCREDADLLLGVFVTIVDGVGQVARTLAKVDPTGAMGKVADRAQVAADKINKLREAVRPTGHEFDKLTTAVGGLGGTLRTQMASGERSVGKVGDAVTAVRGKFAKLQDFIDNLDVGSLKDIGGKKIKSIGDGLGKLAAGPVGGGKAGKGSAALMGANSALSPFAKIGAGFGLHVSSGTNHSKFTTSGNVSYHSTGEAIDVAGDPRGMIGFFNIMKSKYGSRLAELIYGPGKIGIKNGQPFNFGAALNQQHMDHVHVALDLGKPGPGIGDGFGKARKPFTGDGPGKQGSFASTAAKVWARATGLMGSSGAMPAIQFAPRLGNGGTWAVFNGGNGRITVSQDMIDAFRDQNNKKHNYALKALVHEFAHARQRADVMMNNDHRLREGGAEAFAGWASPQIYSALGIPYAYGGGAYEAATKWVVKTKGANWWQHGQFAQASAAKPGAVAASPAPSGIGVAISAARKAGFKGEDLVRMVAIAGRESHYNPRATNFVYPDHSIGLWQINQLAHKGRYGSDKQLMNPDTNARAAWAISGHGRNFTPWSTNKGLSASLLSQARAAIKGKGGGSAAKKAGKKKTPDIKAGRTINKVKGKYTSTGITDYQANELEADRQHGIEARQAEADQIAQNAQSVADEAAAIADKALQDSMDKLTAELALTNLKLELQTQLAQEALRKYNVSQTDYGTLSKALASIVSGEIGGKTGLGFMSPSFAGGGSRY